MDGGKKGTGGKQGGIAIWAKLSRIYLSLISGLSWGPVEGMVLEGKQNIERMIIRPSPAAPLPDVL